MVDYLRNMDSFCLPQHQDDAVTEWLKHVEIDEEAFVRDEIRQAKERAAGGTVLQALALSKEEWEQAEVERKHARDAKRAKAQVMHGQAVFSAGGSLLGSSVTNNMSLLEKMEQEAQYYMQMGLHQQADAIRAEAGKREEAMIRIALENDMHRLNTAYMAATEPVKVSAPTEKSKLKTLWEKL